MSLIDDNWKRIFDKYNIEQKVKSNGLFYITADQIKEFKEPRLMTKFDTRESLPSVFGSKLAILPVTRGKYVIGEFDLYQDFPEVKSEIKQITNIKIPDYFETIDINRITSEANAINVMSITRILDDFLDEQDMVQTISGRMGSGIFKFNIGKNNINNHIIEVQNSQIEIDGGFENHNIFTIIEGKNVVHNNFLIRQLFYPYRLWESKISKPIRPVFMVYSNNIFRLLEYEFEDIKNYNSIKLVQEKNYSLEDVEISIEDIIEVYNTTKVKKEPNNVPFVQADSFDKIISLIENLSNGSLTSIEIAELFGFKERQSDYYFNACKYLGLADKATDENKKTKIFISDTGKRLLKLPYKKRQLEYVRLILEHNIFNEIFHLTIRRGEIPDKRFIMDRMKKLNLCSDQLLERRASSISGWIKWIINLIN